ncbi:hypothetical protein [Ochrobactrum sp. A-1]|uniref:hypothetical protein n=1 Tax=Ochrobactrum sp. A-1 TaxID=2920940 RepID=UPI001F0ACB92|nr:hypothetical protein [Ochrobactrum sp. A-1]
MTGPSLKTQAKRFMVRRIAKAFGPSTTVREIAEETGLDRHFVAKVLRGMRLPHTDGRDGNHNENIRMASTAPVDVLIRGALLHSEVRMRVFD